MSTPPPEPDRYSGSGGADGSDQDVRRDWVIQPAVPGWSAGPNTYAGPSFDDTGWHIDLSGVDWDRPPEPDYGPDASPRRDSGRSHRPTLRLRHHGPAADNARGQPPDGYGRPLSTGRPPAPDGYGGPPRGDGYSAPQGFADPPGRTGYEYPPDAPAVRRPRPGSGRHARPGPPGEQPPAGPGGQPITGLQRPPPADTGRPGRARLRPGAAPPRPGQLPPRLPETGRPGPAVPGSGSPGWEQPGRRRPGTSGPGPVPPGPGRRGPAGAGTLPPSAVLPGADVAAARRPAPESVSIARSSGVMAVGTLGSRLTGFLRTIAQSYALGAIGIGEAYNLSNTLPNAVYYLALGGILTSVIVPLIVNANQRDRGRGGYDQRIFTLVTLALLGVTLVAELAAVPIVHLYAGSTVLDSPPTLHLSVILALFFIPQIFFYGMSSLMGAVLNSRGSFAAPMWTPIVNNVVVIAVLGLYVATAGLHKNPSTISGSEVALLGFGTTLGIIVQTLALLPALRRVGFRWHPRTDFRRYEVREIGRMAGWMFGYVATTWVAFLVTTKAAQDATKPGLAQYNYAWLLFQLPYAVVGISVITALLPRMSAHAAQRRYGLVRQDFSAGVRLSAAIVVPCSLVLAALGPDLAQLFLGHGAMTVADARYTGVVFAVFCLGLVPYMIFQLQLRVFYALHDSRTPAMIGLFTMSVNIVANIIALDTLPHRTVVAALGVGFGLANLVGAVIGWRILSRRLRGLEGYFISRSLVRMHAAALPAALLVVVAGILTGNNFVVVILGGGLAGCMYLLFARALRVDELTGLIQTVRARLGR
jgi:murein biosynthesis integral membrane protein MurJ